MQRAFFVKYLKQHRLWQWKPANSKPDTICRKILLLLFVDTQALSRSNDGIIRDLVYNKNQLAATWAFIWQYCKTPFNFTQKLLPID